MKQKRMTKQKAVVYEILCSTDTHPTADWIYEQARKRIPEISLGTVYRNLNLLVETGEIQKLTCGDGSDHFDGNVSQHYHFVCTECHQVYDMEMGPLTSLDQTAQQSAPGQIHSHSVLFYGTCQKCLEKKSEKGIDKAM